MASAESRVMIGLATAGVVFAVHNKGLPTQADIRVGAAGDKTIETVRKQNLWLSAGIVSGIYLLTKDSVAFMMGGAMVVALDWFTRANNFTTPATNSVIPNPFNVKPSEGAAAMETDATSSSLYAVS